MATTIDNGGPAFPNPALADENFQPAYDVSGMSLRDWFAGQALAGGSVDATATEAELARLFPGSRSVTKQEVVACRAYLIADAMLAARSRT